MRSFSGLGVFGVFSQHLTRRAFIGAVSLAAAASVAHAQTAEITSSITSIAPKLAVAGKLATKTEFLADRHPNACVVSGRKEREQPEGLRIRPRC